VSNSGTGLHVPWITQYATPELIGEIAYRGRPAQDDPNWEVSGAPSQAIYGQWCRNLCGMACLRMVLLARGGDTGSLFELLAGSLEYGCYRIDPSRQIRGMFYEPFTRFVHDRFAIEATVVTDLCLDRLVAELGAGKLVMASVHKEIRRPDREPPGTGGHLVLATRYRDGNVSFNNPSGHTPESGIATLPISTFDSFAAHRGISLRF
jgi:hypothetical protein